VFREMANIANECLLKPRTRSIWSGSLRKYVCEDSEEGHLARAQQSTRNHAQHPPISPTFKFVFRWSFAGTLLFVGLCIVLSLVAGREPPPLFEKVIMATFDLAKIGFGAIVGLLGAKHVEGVSSRTPAKDSETAP
jgi:hypothetical protein